MDDLHTKGVLVIVCVVFRIMRHELLKRKNLFQVQGSFVLDVGERF